jgi:hypothetical protein
VATADCFELSAAHDLAGSLCVGVYLDNIRLAVLARSILESVAVFRRALVESTGDLATVLVLHELGEHYEALRFREVL